MEQVTSHLERMPTQPVAPSPAVPPAVANEPGRSARLPTVDALRGVAAMGVVFYHAYAGGHLKQFISACPKIVEDCFHRCELGVALFFVISGFVIALTLRRATITAGYFGRFLLRRAIRLDPPYWAAIVLMLAAAYLSQRTTPGKPGMTVTFPQLAAHLVYLQDILRYPQINAIFWTLCVEFQFYIIYCLLFWLAQRLGSAQKPALAIVFIPALLISLLWPAQVLYGDWGRGWFLPTWHAFLIGALAYASVYGLVRRRVFYIYAALLAAAIIRNYATQQVSTLYDPNAFSLTALLGAIFLHEAGHARKLETWLNWRWIQFLGMISYSLYLVHNPISAATFRFGFKLTGHSVAKELFWLIGAVLASTAFAFVFWWAIERPSIALSRKLTHK